MSKIDNLFAKVVSDPAFCREYGVTNPEKYDNIAIGLTSNNGYVVAVATALKEISFTYERQVADMRIRGKEGTVVLQDNDMRTLYKKIVTILEKTR